VEEKQQIQQFSQDSIIQNIISDCQTKFGDFKQFEEELSTAFKYYQYYFPDSLIPEVVTFISGFNYQVAVTDKHLAIGLDLYLGAEYPFYKLAMLPNYRVEKMQQNRIVFDAM